MTAAVASDRRLTLLIVGCGDVGMRVLRLLHPRWRLLALTSSAGRMPALRALGAIPLLGDLDRPSTIARLADLADAVLHLAPPPRSGATDTRTRHLVQVLAHGRRLRRLVYGSTSGVYGDCGGAWVDETRPVAPVTDRARRRIDAEGELRAFGRRHGVTVSVLRIPGIYAPGREGGDPRDRLRRGAPVLLPPDDVHTNHIHADDLARACVSALWHGAPQRITNVSDDTDLTVGQHLDAVADRFGLPRPPRITRVAAAEQLSPMQLSFMSESRRLSNRRMKRELGLRLHHPTVLDGLQAADAASRAG